MKRTTLVKSTKKIGKTAHKSAPRTPKKAESVDDQLTMYLRTAEDALIGALELFSGHARPSRVQGYYERLERAQIAVTGLHREELVRIRGLIKTRGKK